MVATKVDNLIYKFSQLQINIRLRMLYKTKKSQEINLEILNLWGEQDSNLRRRSQQIYSLPSLAA